MYCRNCGSQMSDEALFCVHCGVPAGKGKAFCPNCGGDVHPDAVVCVRCGVPLTKARPDHNVQSRGIAMAIILSIVTCGIYGIYWFVKLTDEMNRLSGRTNEASGVTAFLLTLVSCGIYGYYWAYKMGEKKDSLDGKGSSSGVLYLILMMVFPIAVYALAQDAINKVVGED